MSVRIYDHQENVDFLADFCRCGLHLLLKESRDSPATDYKLRGFCHVDRLGIANVTAYNYQYGEDAPVTRFEGEPSALPDQDPAASRELLAETLRSYFMRWYNVYDNEGNGFLGGRDDRFRAILEKFVDERFGSREALFRAP